MLEFFFGFLLVIEPDGDVFYDIATFPTYSECKTTAEQIEQNIKAVAPEGTDIRISCISTESLGQNGI